MRALLTAVGLVVVVSLMWFAWGGEGEAPARAADTPVAEQPKVEPEMSVEPRSPERIPDVGPVERRAVSDAVPEPNVEVVEFGTGEPIAGAVVHYQPSDFDWRSLGDAERQRLAALLGHDQELFMREVGRSVVTDARGRCRVPIGARGTSVIARAAELYGSAYARADEALNRVSMRRDRTLRLLVLDGEDRPVPDISVEMARMEGTVRAMRWMVGTTDEHGRIDKTHVQGMASEDGASPVVVYAQPPGGEGPTVEVDLADVPDDDVVVRMPGTGSVTVQVLDPTGAPIEPRYLGEPTVDLTALDAKPRDRNQETDAFNANRWKATIDPIVRRRPGAEFRQSP